MYRKNREDLMKSVRFIFAGILAFALCVITLNGLNCKFTPAGMIQGEVYYDDSLDTLGGQPVASASVMIKDSSLYCSTDDSGKWQLDGAPAGEQIVVIQKDHDGDGKFEYQLQHAYHCA